MYGSLRPLLGIKQIIIQFLKFNSHFIVRGLGHELLVIEMIYNFCAYGRKIRPRPTLSIFYGFANLIEGTKIAFKIFCKFHFYYFYYIFIVLG